MIIECICGQKKFEVNSELIPDTGRTIQCGSCDKVWFYKPENLNNENQKDYHYQFLELIFLNFLLFHCLNYFLWF